MAGARAVTKLERWQRFSLIYVLGMVVLAPAWISYALDPHGGPYWLLLGHVIAAPLVQVVIALTLFRLDRPSIRMGAIAGGPLVYFLAWGTVFVAPIWFLAVLACPVLAGAAVGQVVAAAVLHCWSLLQSLVASRGEGELRVITAGPNLDVRVTVSIAAAVAGSVAGIALFVWFFMWGIDGLWTDAIYIVPFGISLWALAACAAFLAWSLESE